jgi:hypothetical protein
MSAIYVILIVLGSISLLLSILTFFNRFRAKLILELPRARYIYYQNKEYYYKFKSYFFTFLGDIDLNKSKIKVYRVKRILGIPFKKHINSSGKQYLSNNCFKNVSSLQYELKNIINEYNDKDSNPGWDGCLDDMSRQMRKRNKNIDTIVHD